MDELVRSLDIELKILTVAREMYGAQAVDYTIRARRDARQLEKGGFGGLPVRPLAERSDLRSDGRIAIAAD